MNKTNKIKMTKHFVYMEPELWKLARKMSLINGCTAHPESGSASEGVRKYLKYAMVNKNKNLKNIAGIDWDEMYI